MEVGKMRNNLFFSFLLLFSGAFAAADVLPKLRYDRPLPQVSVEPTGKWEKLPSPGNRNDLKNPPGALAAILSENNFVFNWKPSPDISRVSQPADLTGAILSEDESTLIIAERIGGKDKNNSTRLLFVNLAGARVCGGFELPMRRITAIAAIPGVSGKIIAVQEAQEATNTQNKLLVIDLRRRRITAESAPLPRVISTFATDGSRIWFASSGATSVSEIELDMLNGGEIKNHETKAEICGISFCRSSNSLFVAERGFCEFFSVRPDTLFLEKSLPLPAGFTPVWTLALRQPANSAVIVDNNGKALFVFSGGTMPLQEKVEPYGCLLPDNQVMLGCSRQMQIMRMHFPSADPQGYITPNTLRPANRNKTFKLFARTTNPVQLIQLDERGNIFQITLTGRRGKKNPVMLVDKSGIR